MERSTVHLLHKRGKSLREIAEWLDQGLSGVRMMELARDDPEHPYRGGSSVWRAAVRCERLNGLHEQAVADVPIRFEGLPGEYPRVDWGEIRHFPFTQQKPVTATSGLSAQI